MWLLTLIRRNGFKLKKRCVFRLFQSPCPSYDSLFRYHNDERSNGFGDWQPLLQILDHEVRPDGNFLSRLLSALTISLIAIALTGIAAFWWIVTSTERLPSIRALRDQTCFWVFWFAFLSFAYAR